MQTNEDVNLIVRDEELIGESKGKSLEEIIKEVADEQGLSFEETLKLFQKGIKMMGGMKQQPSAKAKAKAKKKKKIAKASKKNNRK